MSGTCHGPNPSPNPSPIPSPIPSPKLSPNPSPNPSPKQNPNPFVKDTAHMYTFPQKTKTSAGKKNKNRSKKKNQPAVQIASAANFSGTPAFPIIPALAPSMITPLVMPMSVINNDQMVRQQHAMLEYYMMLSGTFT